jgi:hypothetical protein
MDCMIAAEVLVMRRLLFASVQPAAVSTVVHDQLGGVVAHRGIDSTDLSDEVKLLQRLYALNILRLEGTAPDVALWTVSLLRDAGTAVRALRVTHFAEYQQPLVLLLKSWWLVASRNFLQGLHRATAQIRHTRCGAS